MSQIKKYYIVWEGHIPGVYSDWDSCKKQIDKFPKAKYKKFECTEEKANEIFKAGFKGYSNYSEETTNQTNGKPAYKNTIADNYLAKHPKTKKPLEDAIAVDAACSTNPGPVEYRGVDLKSKTIVFQCGPFLNGTNNIGEFLAIVHALAVLHKENRKIPVYSDSMTAIGWIAEKKCKTTINLKEANPILYDAVTRAESWLIKNPNHNIVLKWRTKEWDEIPADYGRK